MKYEVKNVMKIIILGPGETVIVTVPPKNNEVFSIVKFEKKEKKKKQITEDKE